MRLPLRSLNYLTESEMLHHLESDESDEMK
jgi:hypothetical protein